MKVSVLATYVADNYGFAVWRERSQQVFLTKNVVHAGVEKGKVYEVEIVANARDVTGNTPWMAAHLYEEHKPLKERLLEIQEQARQEREENEHIDWVIKKERQEYEEKALPDWVTESSIFEPTQAELDVIDIEDEPPWKDDEFWEDIPQNQQDCDQIYALLSDNGKMLTKDVIKHMTKLHPDREWVRGEIRNRLRTLWEQGEIVKACVFMHHDKRASYNLWAIKADDIIY